MELSFLCKNKRLTKLEIVEYYKRDFCHQYGDLVLKQFPETPKENIY